METLERFRGGLLGLACGLPVHATFEFVPAQNPMRLIGFSLEGLKPYQAEVRGIADGIVQLILANGLQCQRVSSAIDHRVGVTGFV